MTPQETFNAMMQSKKVKLTDEQFEELYRDYKKEVNIFIVHSVEECCVNLYNEEIDEVIYDFPFEEISLF